MHNDQRSAGLVLQSMSLGGGAYHSPQLPPSLMPAHNASLAASPARQRGRNRPSSSSTKKHCNCKNSRCLKLYCECFASGRYCDGCNCVNCCNNMENESTRQSAVEAILERNPNAFRPKIQAGASEEGLVAGTARHNKGCNCKKSGCLKKYCECFQAGIYCGDNCKCIDCKNFEGSEAREAVAMNAFQPMDMASRQPLPHNSPAQNKRARLNSMPMGRQPHPPLPSIPINHRQPLPAIPEPLPRNGRQQGSRHHLSHHQSQSGEAGHQGPLSAAQLNSAAALIPALLPRSDGFLKETLQEMFKRGGIDEVCSLLVLVAQEQADQQANQPTTDGPHQATTDAELQSQHVTNNVDTDKNLGEGSMTKLYEAQERAVLNEYHQVLQKLVDRACAKAEEQRQQSQQQQAPGASLKQPSSEPSSRPPSASVGVPESPHQQSAQQQQLANGMASQGSGNSGTSVPAAEQALQPDELQQPAQQQQQGQPQQGQTQHAHAQQAPALQQTAGQQLKNTAFNPMPGFVTQQPASSSGVSGSHLPVGSSHFRGDQYLLNGMGLQGGHQGVQAGFQRPSSAQSLASRHSTQAGLSVPTGAVNLSGPNQPSVNPSSSEANASMTSSNAMLSMQLPTGSVAMGGGIHPNPSLSPTLNPSMQHQLQQQQQLQQHLRQSHGLSHGGTSDPRLAQYQVGAFSQPGSAQMSAFSQPVPGHMGAFVQSLSVNPLLHSQMMQNQMGSMQQSQGGPMGQFHGLPYSQSGQFQAGVYGQHSRALQQQQAGQMQTGAYLQQPQAGQVQAGVGQMPSVAYLQQPQQGQVKAGNQPQLSQTQRGTFVPQAGQMHSGAFLQQPLPVQMQGMVKQEQAGTAAQNGQAGHVQSSQDQAQQHPGIPDPLT